jgi:histidyl-tRNA synthetase
MKLNLQPVRGTKDVFGKDSEFFNFIISSARNISQHYNFQEIITPIFEFSEVFHRSIGEATDIISKETYTFIDRDKDSLTLRPEFTAGVIRAFVSNGLTQSIPLKFFSAGPTFRHERPQKGRYRQFNQLNFEFIGAKEPFSDVEAIVLATDILKALKLDKSATLELNTVGDMESRRIYRERLVAYLQKYKDELSETSKERLHQNPLRILDSKDAGDRKLLADAPLITASLTDSAKAFFDGVLEGLAAMKVSYVINPKLFRGLDYYTNTVFEFTTDKLGSQGTILAGGRYDGLVSHMGGPQVPAVGFASGIERLMELMKENHFELLAPKVISMIPIGVMAERKAMTLAHILRSQGLNVEYNFTPDLSKRMKHANKIGVSAVIIFGDEELERHEFKVKNMSTGEEVICNEAEIVAVLNAI